MNETSALHPAEAIEPSVRSAEGRAKLAIAALSLTLASRLFNGWTAFAQNELIHKIEGGEQVDQARLATSDLLVAVAGVGQFALLIVTAVLFLRWLHRTSATARMLGALLLHSPKDAVWAFFIPFVNLKRPYDVVKNLHDALLDPSLPEAKAMMVADGAGGYRSVQMQAPPPPVALPAAAVGAWWGMYILSGFVANGASRANDSTLAGLASRNVGTMFSSAFDIVSAVLAIVMVRGVTARLTERYRRVRHNSPEALNAAGVVLEPPAI
ncbi:MAG: DUF4328 domain-containing protein [Polyangiales bacterium]